MTTKPCVSGGRSLFVSRRYLYGDDMQSFFYNKKYLHNFTFMLFMRRRPEALRSLHPTQTWNRF